MTQNLWRLMVFDVPDRLGGLLARHGFRQTRKNPQNWWRTFAPEKPGARAHAKSAIAQLRQAGLEIGKRNWSEVEPRDKPHPRVQAAIATKQDRLERETPQRRAEMRRQDAQREARDKRLVPGKTRSARYYDA